MSNAEDAKPEEPNRLAERYGLSPADEAELQRFFDFLVKDPTEVALQVVGIAHHSPLHREYLASLYKYKQKPWMSDRIDGLIRYPKRSPRYWLEYFRQLFHILVLTGQIIQELTGYDLGAKKNALHPAFDSLRFIAGGDDLLALMYALHKSKEPATQAALPSASVASKCLFASDIIRRDMWSIPDDVTPESFPSINDEATEL